MEKRVVGQTATPTEPTLKRRRPDDLSNRNGYEGYSFQTGTPIVEEVGYEIEPKEFFVRYISPRKPCVIQGWSSSAGQTPFSIKLNDLVRVAGNEVEKRHSLDEFFGQNRTSSRQIAMNVKQFVDKLDTEEGQYLYLSTQQPQSQDDESSVKGSGFQVPCEQLLDANMLGNTLTWAGKLRLESCNVWVGSSQEGSCSGLHHDYHDNFYLLLEGQKQFRLYSPDTAPFMETFGSIDQIHFNGVISYVGNETRADGVPLALVEEQEDNGSDGGDIVTEDSSDEEEVIVGKGFDYESSDDEEAFDDNGPDDFDALVGDDEDEAVNDEVEPERPNSFSTINPATVSDDQHPMFKSCKEYVVNLRPGDVLYLPAGWFHSVTSSSPAETKAKGSKGGVHFAFNYWFHPPDKLDSFEQPYQFNEVISKDSA